MGSRILVVGAGAVGGYFGARMANAGHDVTFLVRERRLQQLRAGGLCLISSVGNVTIAPRMVMAGGIEGPYDIILLSVKAYSLTGAMNDFAPAVGSRTRIVPLLNGMQHLDILADRFGPAAVMGGRALSSASLIRRGALSRRVPSPGFPWGHEKVVRRQRRAVLRKSCRVPDLKRCVPPTSCRTCGTNGFCSPPWAASAA
nr:2-dehydropantoate 2-reductase N-terminal domain-containing protein [Komagataeibacter xylinus]